MVCGSLVTGKYVDVHCFVFCLVSRVKHQYAIKFQYQCFTTLVLNPPTLSSITLHSHYGPPGNATTRVYRSEVIVL